MLQGVRFYCPPGVSLPEHRADLRGRGAIVIGPGPSADPNAPIGGAVYGGVYEDHELGWHPTPAGWWLHLGQAIPQLLRRVATHPRIVTWSEVLGAYPEHRWRVPVLLRQQPTDDDQPPVFDSALERVWRGGRDWAEPEELTALQDRLLAVAQGIATAGSLDAQDDELTAVVIALLELGHRISEHELIAGGWLTDLVRVRVLLAATGAGIIAEAGAA
jgi:hypothetical protein